MLYGSHLTSTKAWGSDPWKHQTMSDLCCGGEDGGEVLPWKTVGQDDARLGWPLSHTADQRERQQRQTYATTVVTSCHVYLGGFGKRSQG